MKHSLFYRVVSITLAFVLSVFMASATYAQEAKINNIVLVHGAFADGSSWSAVTARLQALGYHVTAVQNPLTSLHDDVAATLRVIKRQQGDVLLVGHSWAGAVITQAGNDPAVKGLVYLSALIPASGESVNDLLQSLNAPMEGLKPDRDGLIWLDDPTLFHDVMANDVSDKKSRLLSAVQQPIAAQAFTEKVQQAASKTKPSWYLLTESDNALRPGIQETLAHDTGATLLRIPSSHMSMISHPDAVAAFIDNAARHLK